MQIPEKLSDILSWKKKAFAHLAVVLQDGTPHVTPVWFDYDGTYIIINSALGRVKDKVMRRHPQVALAVSDPEDPYRYVQIQGSVVEITEEGARNMIDNLSQKYTEEPYQWYEGETRVTYKVIPERVSPID
jgi:PPOX class probable F420-dependent enzyme